MRLILTLRKSFEQYCPSVPFFAEKITQDMPPWILQFQWTLYKYRCSPFVATVVMSNWKTFCIHIVLCKHQNRFHWEQVVYQAPAIFLCKHPGWTFIGNRLSAKRVPHLLFYGNTLFWLSSNTISSYLCILFEAFWVIPCRWNITIYVILESLTYTLHISTLAKLLCAVIFRPVHFIKSQKALYNDIYLPI